MLLQFKFLNEHYLVLFVLNQLPYSRKLTHNDFNAKEINAKKINAILGLMNHVTIITRMATLSVYIRNATFR